MSGLIRILFNNRVDQRGKYLNLSISFKADQSDILLPAEKGFSCNEEMLSRSDFLNCSIYADFFSKKKKKSRLAAD